MVLILRYFTEFGSFRAHVVIEEVHVRCLIFLSVVEQLLDIEVMVVRSSELYVTMCVQYKFIQRVQGRMRIGVAAWQ